MSLYVDTWDPSYGSSLSGDERSASEVRVDTEVEEVEWEPVSPPSVAEARLIRLVDGVRRIDGRVWRDAGDGGPPHLGIAASYAAGVVTCDLAAGSATLGTPLLERGVFSAAQLDIPPIRGAVYTSYPASNGDQEYLVAAIQDRLRKLEIKAAADAGSDHDLIIVDGPLGGRAALHRALGYIKTHRTQYLPPAQVAIVGRLTPGQRTPIFKLSGVWERYTWYLQLPGGDGSPWAGVVRVECQPGLPVADVVELAGLSAVTLPKLASSPYKDPRAPQNLLPIGGLERRLRALLGDARLLHRSLRLAVQQAG
ncbi:DNA double-strand break repair nuclease NurA [Longispora albida]|uniref:DNA double-strand break repair nuclease NurA n=1 Tax=Longispora albida TaxID=203523 RepID=UPI000369A265|nr:DNA double-strand break repair nuclease NurA [Longispora albida]